MTDTLDPAPDAAGIGNVPTERQGPLK